MKTKSCWLNFIIHDRKRSWSWKPVLLKSKLIYKLQQKMWQAPLIEWHWLFLVIQFTFYSKKIEYKGNNFIEEDLDALQDRVATLEQGIRLHQALTELSKTQPKDTDLWSLLE